MTMTTKPAISITDARCIWDGALAVLRTQMAKETYDSLLRGSHVIYCDSNEWTISVRSEHAAAWLPVRLKTAVQRAVERIAGAEISILFIAGQPTLLPHIQVSPSPTAEPAPEDPPPAGDLDDPLDLQTITLPELVAFEAEFNERIRKRGFAMLTNYAIRFWSELLGPVPFLCWIAAFARDKRDKTKFTGLSQPVKFSIARLARIAAAGRVQAVRGVWRKCPGADCPSHAGPDRGSGNIEACGYARTRLLASGPDGVCRYWQPGAFDVLRAEAVGLVDVNCSGAWRPWDPAQEQPGQALRRQRYRLRVYVPLPLLTPAQVSRLEDVSQDEHESWLEEAGIDKGLWESLTVDSLGMTAIEGGAA